MYDPTLVWDGDSLVWDARSIEWDGFVEAPTNLGDTLVAKAERALHITAKAERALNLVAKRGNRRT